MIFVRDHRQLFKFGLDPSAKAFRIAYLGWSPDTFHHVFEIVSCADVGGKSSSGPVMFAAAEGGDRALAERFREDGFPIFQDYTSTIKGKRFRRKDVAKMCLVECAAPKKSKII